MKKIQKNLIAVQEICNVFSELRLFAFKHLLLCFTEKAIKDIFSVISLEKYFS